jgi:hypothetical protein
MSKATMTTPPSAGLFEKYIRQWSTKQEEAKEREQRGKKDRSLGDRDED